MATLSQQTLLCVMAGKVVISTRANGCLGFDTLDTHLSTVAGVGGHISCWNGPGRKHATVPHMWRELP